MKALLSHQAGGPETLQLEEVPEPVAGAGELLIRVEAVGVNYPDGLFIRDLYQVRPERPFAPGGELCGVVEAVGGNATGFEVGDRVIGRCGWGAMAEKIVLAPERCVRIPLQTPAVEAAAFMFAYATAYHALRDAGRLRAGERVLVLGAAGGVGSAGVELARALGAEVKVAVSSEEKLRFALARGAQGGMVYPREVSGAEAERALALQFKELGGGEGFDVVFDPVGGAYSEAAIRALRRHGRHLVIGFTAGIPRVPLNLLLLKSCQVIGVDWRTFLQHERASSERNVASLLAMWREGLIAPRVSEAYPLDEAWRAIACLDDRKAMGKLVVRLGSAESADAEAGAA